MSLGETRAHPKTMSNGENMIFKICLECNELSQSRNKFFKKNLKSMTSDQNPL